MKLSTINPVTWNGEGILEKCKRCDKRCIKRNGMALLQVCLCHSLLVCGILWKWVNGSPQEFHHAIYSTALLWLRKKKKLTSISWSPGMILLRLSVVQLPLFTSLFLLDIFVVQMCDEQTNRQAIKWLNSGDQKHPLEDVENST